MWKRILSRSVQNIEDLPESLASNKTKLQAVVDRYPMRINPYYLGLIKHRRDPIYQQCIPHPLEISDEKGFEDPLNEEGLSPVPGLTHHYPDRVLFLVSSQCAVYCRFCNRKRKVGTSSMVTRHSIREGLSYIRAHSEIRDVLLSGGDPLLLENRKLHEILKALRAVPHVEIIRIGTRVPCTLPQRITSRLTEMLKQFHPIYISTHFNHPVEITPEASAACRMLADAGIPLNCQTVLLKGVNDRPEIIKELVQRLLMIRVRPYYLFQCDLTRGTSHFWTPLSTGLNIMGALQGHTSGLCVPHFAVDLPEGGGKVFLFPEHIAGREEESFLIRDYSGNIYRYPI